MLPGYGYQMSYGVGALLSLALLAWFVIFTILVVIKLNRIIELLSKK